MVLVANQTAPFEMVTKTVWARGLATTPTEMEIATMWARRSATRLTEMVTATAMELGMTMELELAKVWMTWRTRVD